MILLSSIRPNPSNPRIIKDDRFRKLVNSIKEFPKMMDLRPMVVDENGHVLGGNMRLKALEELKYKEIPDTWVKKASELTEEEKKRFIISDNIGYGEWDWEALGNEWDQEQLLDWGLEIPAFAFKGECKEDDYEIPDEIKTDIVLGDLFEIGVHRLICGDSTSADDVAKLLQGKEPYLMVTDPPYGVNYDPTWRDGVSGEFGVTKVKMRGKVSNDDKVDWTEVWVLSPAKVAYIWHGDRHAATVQRSLESCDFQIRCQIVWVKPSLTLSRGDYHWQHEPLWYAVKKGNKGNWAGDRKQTTVWEIAGLNPAGKSHKAEDSKTNHGTQKPVECMARPIKNHDGDVYDPFLGSGTTMVAAHQLGRKCFGIEISPQYCQVIIDRMRKLDPNLPISKNGISLN
jgi:DNA modification methylase